MTAAVIPIALLAAPTAGAQSSHRWFACVTKGGELTLVNPQRACPPGQRQVLLESTGTSPARVDRPAPEGRRARTRARGDKGATGASGAEGRDGPARRDRSERIRGARRAPGVSRVRPGRAASAGRQVRRARPARPARQGRRVAAARRELPGRPDRTGLRARLGPRDPRGCNRRHRSDRRRRRARIEGSTGAIGEGATGSDRRLGSAGRQRRDRVLRRDRRRGATGSTGDDSGRTNGATPAGTTGSGSPRAEGPTGVTGVTGATGDTERHRSDRRDQARRVLPVAAGSTGATGRDGGNGRHRPHGRSDTSGSGRGDRPIILTTDGRATWATHAPGPTVTVTVPDEGGGTGFIDVMAQVHASEAASAVGLFDVTGGGDTFVAGQDTVCPDRVTGLPPGTIPGDLFITPDNDGTGVEGDYGTPEVASQSTFDCSSATGPPAPDDARGDRRHAHLPARVRGLRCGGTPTVSNRRLWITPHPTS